MIGFITDDEQIDKIIEERPKTIPELFPEYDFIAVEEELTKYKTLLIFSVVIPVFWLVLIGFLVSGFFSRMKNLYTSIPKIVYIQNTHWWTKLFYFIVDENRKWGLIDSALQIRIPPQYDSMKWFKKDKLIEVKSGRKTMLIDIKNNICV